MAEKKIIFQLQDGITVDEVGTIFSGLVLPPRRLHNIDDKVDILLKALDLDPNDLSTDDRNSVFDTQIYPFLTDIQKELYRTYVVEVDETEGDRLLEDLKRSNLTDYRQYSFEYQIEFNPTPSAERENSGLGRIHCHEAWYTSKGDEVIVAVIDSGVDYKHKYIEKRLWRDGEYFGRNFLKGGSEHDPMDQYGHGTHCAGIVSADNDELLEVAVAPKAKIMALKIFDLPSGGMAATDTEP